MFHLNFRPSQQCYLTIQLHLQTELPEHQLSTRQAKAATTTTTTAAAATTTATTTSTATTTAEFVPLFAQRPLTVPQQPAVAPGTGHLHNTAQLRPVVRPDGAGEHLPAARGHPTTTTTTAPFQLRPNEKLPAATSATAVFFATEASFKAKFE